METFPPLILIFWIIFYPFLLIQAQRGIAAQMKSPQDIFTKEWEVRQKTGP